MYILRDPPLVLHMRTNLLAAGSASGHFPTCISRGGTWLGFERAITQTEEVGLGLDLNRQSPGQKRWDLAWI